MITVQALTAGGIMASNPTQSLTFTGFEPEIQDITRQREMAKMLLQQGMNQNDMQGQMVSGRYVGASPWQGIAKMYQAYTGGQMAKEADRKQAELAEMLRKLGAQESQDILKVMRGTPEEVTYSAEDVGPTRTVTPAVAGDIEKAYLMSSGARTPQGQAFAPLLFKQLSKEPKWEKVERLNPRTGDTTVGMVDVNSKNPSATFTEIGVSKPAISVAEAARLRDEGISIPVGQTVSGGGAVAGGGAAGAQQIVSAIPAQDRKFLPSNLPTFQPDPSLPPKLNRELQAKFTEDLRKNVKNAKESFETIQAASEILGSNRPSSGRGENIITGVREFFGKGGEQSKADSELKILAQKLTGQVPRFEGPQSNVDVAMYQAAAGDIGNPNIPIASRLAALQTLVRLNKKYYPEGDWDSINLNEPNIKPNMFGGRNTYFGATVQPRKETGWRIK